MRRHITQSGEGSPSPARGRRASRTGSIDTLSPCESIASDDLMMDFEQSEGSGFDCTAERFIFLISYDCSSLMAKE